MFRPLGIREDDSWPTDADGYTWGWAGLRLTARDVAKLGYLYLRGGRWNGRQIVPASWVRESTAVHVRFGARGFGYAYFWWRARIAGRDAFYGLGYGGQFLLIVPSRDVVAVLANLPPGGGADPMPILRLIVAAAK